jgi:tRNA pseudouridine13 synthase
VTIRRLPEDFLVEERLGQAFASALVGEPTDGARQATFELRKTGLSTPNAVQGLARTLGVRNDAVSYAGLKDRHAKTVQHLTVHFGGVDTAAFARLASEGLKGGGEGGSWYAKLIGWSDRPIAAEHIDGNRFTVVVRDLARNATHEMDRRAHVLKDGDGLVIVNYFGDQRFGSARHGEGFAARHLVRGEFEAALKLLVATPARKDQGATRILSRAAATHWGDWQRILAEVPRMPERAVFEALAAGKSFRDAFAALPAFTQLICVEAFQSHLWNAVARRLAERMGDPKTRLERDDPFGVMIFPFARMVEPRLRDVILPLFGPNTQYEPEWAAEAEAVLAEESLRIEDLVIPGLRRPFFGEAPRPLFVRAEGFAQERPVPDTFDPTGKRFARTLRFSLPRGAYATVVLRALGQ